MATPALVPKISKTTPCKVEWRSPACAIPRRQFDSSGKSPVKFHHRAICKTQTNLASGATDHTPSPAATLPLVLQPLSTAHDLPRLRSHARTTASRPPHPAPRLVTIGPTPLCIRDGTERSKHGFRKNGISMLLVRALDRKSEPRVICPSCSRDQGWQQDTPDRTAAQPALRNGCLTLNLHRCPMPVARRPARRAPGRSGGAGSPLC